jgi:hypothetical protein
MTDSQPQRSVEYYLMQFPVSNEIKGAAFSVVEGDSRTWSALNRRTGEWFAAPELNKSLFGDGDINLHPVDRVVFLGSVRAFSNDAAVDAVDAAIEKSAQDAQRG